MRILLVHSFYNASLPSGENTVVKDQARLLAEHGHDVLLWGPQTPSEMTTWEQASLGLNVLTGRGGSPADVISSFQPELIHVHNLFPNISTGWLAHASAPIAVTLHNYRAVCANGVLLRQGETCTKCVSGSAANALRHGCYRDSSLATAPVLAFQRRFREVARRQVGAVIFTSELSRQVLEPEVRPQRSILLPNYVPAIGSLTQVRLRDRPGFVTMGRLSPEKGFDRLMEAWPSSERLTVLGDGPDLTRLRALALGKDIEFKGFVPDSDRDWYLQNAQALILPSITMEADPVVVAQALSTGTPCIARSGTATAQLARASSAITPYWDDHSLLGALDAARSGRHRRAAKELYARTWSRDAWLFRYRTDVVHRLVIKHSEP